MRLQTTMLGYTGVGKTTFTAAMYHELGRMGVSGFSVDASPDDDAFLGLMYKGMAVSGQWPPQTTDRRQTSFQLRYGEIPVVDFVWIDYPGGDTASQSGGNPNSGARVLYADLLGSNAIMILADAWYIANTSPQIADERNEVSRILKLLRDFLDTNRDKSLAIAVVLTKCDTVEPVQWPSFVMRCYSLFGRLVALLEDPSVHHRLRGVFIPVSVVGAGNGKIEVTRTNGSFMPSVSTSLAREPQPTNVHWPVLYLLARELEFSQYRLAAQVRALNSMYHQAKGQAGTLDDIIRFFTSRESKSQQAKRLAGEILDTKNLLQGLRLKLQPLLTQVVSLPEVNSRTMAMAPFYH